MLSYLLNINLQIPNFNFSEKTAFESGLLFLREKMFFFRTCHFSLFSAEPLYQNVRIDHRTTFTFL